MKKIILIIMFLFGLITFSYADYKDLEQCNIGNNLPICTGKVETKQIITKKITEDDIVLAFFTKFLTVINNLYDESSIKVKTYFESDTYSTPIKKSILIEDVHEESIKPYTCIFQNGKQICGAGKDWNK